MKELNKEELVKKAFAGYVEYADNENKVVVDLNGFDEEIKEYLLSKHIDDEDYVYYDDEEYDDLGIELNKLLVKVFKDNGYVVYSSGDIYAEDGKFITVSSDTNIAIKEELV